MYRCFGREVSQKLLILEENLCLADFSTRYECNFKYFIVISITSSVSSMSLFLVVPGYIIYCSSYNVLVHFTVTDFRVNEMET